MRRKTQMKKIKLALLYLLIIGLGLSDLAAQSMYVNEKVGTQTIYSLSEISNLSFSSGNLIIKQSDNGEDIFSLLSLQYLSFLDSTTVNIDNNKQIGMGINTYPNPVTSLLTIDCTENGKSIGTFQILNLNGKLMFSVQIDGSGLYSIDMSHLPGGTYIGRAIHADGIQSLKIIKQ